MYKVLLLALFALATVSECKVVKRRDTGDQETVVVIPNKDFEDNVDDVSVTNPFFFSFRPMRIPAFPAFDMPPLPRFPTIFGAEDDDTTVVADVPSLVPPAFDFLEDQIKTLQQEVTSLFDMFFTSNRNNTSVHRPSIFDFGNGGFDFAPDNDTNSTSTTEVVNGTVITTNSTTQHNSGDGFHSVFHVQTVHVRPSETPEEIPEKTTEDPVSSTTAATDETNEDDEPAIIQPDQPIPEIPGFSEFDNEIPDGTNNRFKFEEPGFVEAV